MSLHIKRLVLLMTIAEIVFTGCKKENSNPAPPDGFILSSPVIHEDSLLPAKYTCDGSSSTLPLSWSGSPENTKAFALIMHHEASPTDIHWYWVLYNIPSDIRSLAENITGKGILGNNSVNGHAAYAPPCSQGPGPKKYILTLFALSDSVSTPVPPVEVSRDVLLEAMKNITIASTSLTVIYSRNIKK